MTRTIAVSGASGKTGFRIAEELLRVGDQPRLLLRPDSVVPASLAQCEQHRLQLSDRAALDAALSGCDGLVIATGARPSVDLTGPMRVDAWGVQHQVESCQRLGIRRVVLVSSLCAGRWRHPLNLFGLILVWKRLGESWLEQSGLEWTVIRPGGLKEAEDNLAAQQVTYSAADQQQHREVEARALADIARDHGGHQGERTVDEHQRQGEAIHAKGVVESDPGHPAVQLLQLHARLIRVELQRGDHAHREL